MPEGSPSKHLMMTGGAAETHSQEVLMRDIAEAGSLILPMVSVPFAVVLLASAHLFIAAFALLALCMAGVASLMVWSPS